MYPVTGHPVGEANYLAVEGQGPVGMSTTAIILAQFKVAKANDFMLPLPVQGSRNSQASKANLPVVKGTNLHIQCIL